MSDIDKPNVTLPLAASYNERSGQVFGSITQDQRKVNSQYEVVQNAITGKYTSYLVKRNGFTAVPNAQETAASATGVPYLIQASPDNTQASWVVSKDGISTLVRNTSTGTSTFITSHASSFPVYFDKAFTNATIVSVLQLYNNADTKWQTWFSSSIGTWSRVTSANFSSLAHVGKMQHMDGYAFQMISSNRIHNSDLNTLDVWPALGYLTKSIEQDQARGLIRHNNLILAMGAETAEVYYNAGYATGSPLERIAQLAARVGLVWGANDAYGNPFVAGPDSGTTHYSAYLNGRSYFVGTESGTNLASRGVFIFDGQKFQRISTPFIDKLISNVVPTSVGVLNMPGQQAIAFGLTRATSTVGTTSQWLMYFPRWNDWFEWNSVVVQPISDGRATLGIGVYSTGVWSSDAVSNNDKTSSYQFQHTFTLPGDGNRRSMVMMGVVGDTTSVSLGVEFSDDDYTSWVSTDPIDMATDRKRIYRQGAFHERAIRLTYTGGSTLRLQKFVARLIE